MKIISLDRALVIEELKRIANKIRSLHPEVGQIILFGSIARGTHSGTSDADVLLVADSCVSPDPSRRALEYLPYFDLPIGTDLLVLTAEELEERSASGDPFIRLALEEGVQL